MTESEYCTLYTQQRDKAVAYCSRLLKEHSNLAEDVTQAVFMELWTAIQAPHTPIDNPKAYLYASLRNEIKRTAIAECRQTEICKKLSHKQPCQHTEIDKTPLITAHYTDGYTQTEIAEQNNTSQSTVSRRLARDMSELRGSLTNA